VLVDELLAKNFAVLGATGSGKSCAVALMISAILTDCTNAHIIVLDPHNEYASAFGEQAELFSVDNLQLPLWLLDFEETVGVLVRSGTVQEQEIQTTILKDAVTRARRRHWSDAATSITVDTPVPFAAADLLRFIEEAMGKLDNVGSLPSPQNPARILANRPPICIPILRLGCHPGHSVANRWPSAADSSERQTADPSSIYPAFPPRLPMLSCPWCAG
jgi:DNA helicase HerA-like ATPase